MMVDAPNHPPLRRERCGSRPFSGRWRLDGAGLPGLIESIQAHAGHLRQSGDWAKRERARLEAEFDLLIQQTLVARFARQRPEKRLDEALDAIQKRKISPRRSGVIC